MANRSHLNKLEHGLQDEGVAESIEEMLPYDCPAPAALHNARRDVVGSKDL